MSKMPLRGEKTITPIKYCSQCKKIILPSWKICDSKICLNKSRSKYTKKLSTESTVQEQANGKL